MSLSVSAVKNLMATLGVKVDELFSAEEFKIFLSETVAKHGLIISDVFDEKAQNLFVEEWFKHNPENLEGLFSAQSQETFVLNWVKSHPDSLSRLFPNEAERLKKTDEFVVKDKACTMQNQAEEQQPVPEKTVSKMPDQPKQTTDDEKLEFVRDGGYQFVRQNGKTIGVLIETGSRRFIVMHDYDQDNLSKDEAQKRAYARLTVKGRHWRLLTDADCRAMCSSLRTGGGNGDASLAALMRKLGGDFVHKEHLTSHYYGPQKYKVKYAVDLD